MSEKAIRKRSRSKGQHQIVNQVDNSNFDDLNQIPEDVQKDDSMADDKKKISLPGKNFLDGVTKTFQDLRKEAKYKMPDFKQAFVKFKVNSKEDGELVQQQDSSMEEQRKIKYALAPL